jgi:ubiquinone/menaquinone biosynthesis C-methylase UbiE
MADDTQRFTGRVEAYERYRERYPTTAVLALLRQWCGLTPEWTVADIGAGTGMLAEVFLENGNRVVAVEPNAEMRSACEMLRERWPKLDVVDATAEDTGLEDASVEMVAAGRAFHWFDTEKSLAEFRRVLKPGGWVVLTTARRAQDANEQSRAFETLLIEFGRDYAKLREKYRVHEELGGLFAELHQEEIHGEQQLDWESFGGLTHSLSASPKPGEDRYEAFQVELRKFFERYAHDGVLTIVTSCWVSAGRW